MTGWFTHDFTLAELRTLRAVERIPQLRQHNTLYDGRFPVPTFQEVIDLAKAMAVSGLVVFLPIILTVARRFGGSLLYYALPAWYIRTTRIKDQTSEWRW